MNNLGSVYNESGDHLKAEAVFLNAIPIARRVLGDNHDCTRLMEQNLALTYCLMGRYAEAEAPLARSFRKGATKPHVYQVQIMAMI